MVKCILKKIKFFVIIDSYTLCLLKTRKEAHTYHNKIDGCTPCLFKQPYMNLTSESCSNLANRFSSDVESEHLLNDEFNRYKIIISTEDSMDSSYKMLTFFPNLAVVLRMKLSTALTKKSLLNTENELLQSLD